MDENKKTNLGKRVGAIVLIVLFIALILNLFLFKFYLEISLGIYVLIIVYYLFFNSRKNRAIKENNEREIKEDEQ